MESKSSLWSLLRGHTSFTSKVLALGDKGVQVIHELLYVQETAQMPGGWAIFEPTSLKKYATRSPSSKLLSSRIPEARMLISQQRLVHVVQPLIAFAPDTLRILPFLIQNRPTTQNDSGCDHSEIDGVTCDISWSLVIKQSQLFERSHPIKFRVYASFTGKAQLLIVLTNLSEGM